VCVHASAFATMLATDDIIIVTSHYMLATKIYAKSIVIYCNASSYVYYSFNDSFALFCSAFISIAYKIVYFYEYRCDRSWFFAHKLSRKLVVVNSHNYSCAIGERKPRAVRESRECKIVIEIAIFCLRNERCAGCSLVSRTLRKFARVAHVSKQKKKKLHIESAGKYMMVQLYGGMYVLW
jgi:hypothetical protein